LNELVVQVVELTRARWFDIAQCQGIQIAVETKLDSDLPLVSGVEHELRDVFTNLVFNAVDAMPSGGVLTIATRVVQGAALAGRRQVVVEVSDTGVGMDEETRRSCLDPFFTTKGDAGTGLGLAMVSGTVKRHEASLEVDTAVDHGTTFRLKFDVPEKQPRLAVEPPPSLPPAPLRILLVDDDLVLLKALQRTLRLEGHSTVAFQDGRSALDLFELALHEGVARFDCVITDLGMPRMDGRMVARAVKSSSSATPVILLTGWGQRLDGEPDSDVDILLSKPPKLAELRAALARTAVTGLRPGRSVAEP
jgi:CheY-like chemotaxis protein